MFSDIREYKKMDTEKTNVFILTLSSQEWLNRLIICITTIYKSVAMETSKNKLNWCNLQHYAM